MGGGYSQRVLDPGSGIFPSDFHGSVPWGTNEVRRSYTFLEGKKKEILGSVGKLG